VLHPQDVVYLLVAGSALAGLVIEAMRCWRLRDPEPAWLAHICACVAAYTWSFLLIGRSEAAETAEPWLLLNTAALCLMVHALIAVTQRMGGDRGTRIPSSWLLVSTGLALLGWTFGTLEPIGLGLVGGAHLWVLRPSALIALLFAHHLAAGAVATRNLLVSPHLRLAGTGLALWLLTGMVDVLMTFAVVPAVLYLSPIGFLAAAAGFAMDSVDSSTRRLHRSEGLNEALLNELDDGVVVLDNTGRVRLWNAALAHMTGGNAQHMIGQDLTTSGLFTQAERTLLEHALHTASSGLVGTNEHVAEVGRDTRTFRTTFSRAESGEVVGVVRDITDERQLAARLAAADRVIALGTLAAGIGHEIANPLQYLTSNLDYVLAELEQSDTSLTEALQDARAGATRIEEVVDDLRALASAKDQTEEAVELHEVAAAAVQVGAAGLRERGITLDLDLQVVPPTVGQHARLIQVVLNLLTNAAAAVSKRESGTILVSTSTAGGHVRLDVADDGPGIDDDDRARIFDAFFTTRAAEGGSGLGLAISQRIVEDHGGWLEVDSEPGAGATFRMVLPVRAPAGK